MTHSRLAPSSAHVWMNCPGSVKMLEFFPEGEESEASRMGTLAHELAAKMIDAQARASDHTPETDDEEMIEAAEMYADHVRKLTLETNVFGGFFFGLEKPVTMYNIHPEMYGTPDFFVVDTKNKVMHIVDFKYGRVPVEVFENFQLISYAAGVFDSLERHTPFLSESNQDFAVKFHIVQPRAFHRDGPIRTWATTLGALQCKYFGGLRAAALHAFESDASVYSGSHCHYCPARHGCEAALKATSTLYEAAADAVPLDLSTAALATQLAIVLRAHSHLGAIKDALEQQVESLIKAGQFVPGFAAVPSVGREAWKADLSEVFALGDMLGVELRKPGAVTPKQAKKLGIDEAVIMAYSHSTTSGLKIVPDNGTKARLIFGEKI